MTSSWDVGVISRENRVIIVFGLLSLVVLYGTTQVTDLPAWAGIAAVIPVGVVIPQLVDGTYTE